MAEDEDATMVSLLLVDASADLEGATANLALLTLVADEPLRSDARRLSAAVELEAAAVLAIGARWERRQEDHGY